MEGLLFLFGLFLALGLFFLAASLLHLPDGQTGAERCKDIGNLFYDSGSQAVSLYPNG